MICEHLRELEEAILAEGITESYRGQPWSKNCREWVYFDCVFNASAIGASFDLPHCVSQHFNNDPKSGREFGLVCDICHDGIVGIHPQDGTGKKLFPATND